MVRVVFVAPYVGGQMRAVLDRLAGLDCQLGIVTHEPRERLPASVQEAAHYRIGNALDAEQLIVAVRAFQKEWGGVDRLVGYLEPLQVALGDARDACGIEGLGGEAARNFRDKNRMKEVLGAAGLPVARQALVKSADDARSFAQVAGYPMVLKPLDGAGARNTLRVRDDDDLYRALNRLMPTPERPVQAEQFVQGVEHTCETVMVDGKPVWTSSVDYLPGPMAVMENPWMQYCVLLPREEPDYLKAFIPTNHAALKALGLHTGLSHMEWFRRPDGITIGEVGARPPGVNILDLNKAVYGADMWQAWLELMIFDRWTVPQERTAAAGCAFPRAQGPNQRITGIHRFDEVREALGERIVAARWPRPGQVRSSHYEGDGWVIVKHETTEGVMDALEHLVKTLRVVA